MTEVEWRAVSVTELIGRSVRPFVETGDAERFELTGPEVWLPPTAAVAFVLAIHELCTNAAKYGALSTAAGKVFIDWRLAPGPKSPRLQLTWRETGGPPVSPPAARGFGSRLLERGLAEELQGEVRLDFQPAGLVCHMDLWAPVDPAAEDANADLFPLPI
jgi:two-component sensor histidine kinase